MNKITVAGAIVSKNGISLFLASGEPMVLPQENWRTKEILDYVLPFIGRQQTAEVDLDAYSIASKVAAATGLDVKESADGKLTVTTANGTVDGGKLEKQLLEIAQGRSAKGFKNFMRLFDKSKVKHSADELLHFMEKNDLTIADDGSIIGYKILRVKDAKEGIWVDPHTKLVKQRLGSLVFMPRSKVNDDRRVACATGLHICNQNYIGGFGGDVLTLTKIRPNDVIAVPHSEDKMRVAAYQIVALLPEDVYRHVKQKKPITDHPDGNRILADVIVGNHPAICERVEVGVKGEHKVEPVVVKAKAVKRIKKAAKKATKVVVPVKKGKVERITAKDVRKVVKKTPREKAQAKYAKKFEQAKRLVVKGWSLRRISEKLGIDRNSLSENLRKG